MVAGHNNDCAVYRLLLPSVKIWRVSSLDVCKWKRDIITRIHTISQKEIKEKINNVKKAILALVGMH